MTRPASPHGAGASDTFWRSLQTFGITRIVITVLLLTYLNYSPTGDARTLSNIISAGASSLYLALSVLFLVLSIYVRQRFMLQLLVQLSIDLLVISKLYLTAGGIASGLAILYLFPLAGCAILAPLLLALFIVSVVTMVLLGESGYQLLRAGIPSSAVSQAGLYGAAFFAAVYTINRLAASLLKQEALAMRRGRALRLQEAINSLIVADMGDGVLVVGGDTTVYACNPAVERMLAGALSGLAAGTRLSEVPALRPVADAFTAWKEGRQAGSTEGPGYYVLIAADGVPGSELPAPEARDLPQIAHLRLRFAKVEATEPGEERMVIFMQDVSEIENRAQQLKLASMGRLTASIAHEVRNPLSAISHAASLLREDVSDPTQTRLLNIVGENVVRLDRMIEDILKLSRKAQVYEEPVELARAVTEIVAEFVDNQQLTPGLIACGDMRGYLVRFDPLHFREVVVNLLSNALRYASGADGSIRLQARVPKSGRVELHVQDDGEPITPQVRAHLFEPFYTTSNKGTGLGLYVARELCLNNGAMLDYEYRSDPGQSRPTGRFVISFYLARN